ncbi:MAG: sensor histidine kinase [bacterium]
MNLAICVSAITISFLGLLLTGISRALEPRTRCWFLVFFSLLVLYGVCNLLTLVTEGLPGRGWHMVVTLSLFFESFFSSLILPLLTVLFLTRGGVTDWQRGAAFRAVLFLWLVYAFLLVFTQFSTAIYYFDAENLYHRGPYYPILLVPTILIQGINLGVVYWYIRRYTRREAIAFTLYCVAPLAAMVLQMLFSGIFFILLGTVVAAMVLLLCLQADQMDRYAHQEAVNTQLRVDIMLSQIQPHFLYNALGSIGRLCRDNPEAREAIRQFSCYLRGNMASLSATQPIPFTSELEHTRAYLALEALRFKEKLHIVYDLETTDFLIPALTLQPLVENAVFHGVRGNADGRGTVTISSWERVTFHEITVTDDGPGFDPAAPAPNDGRTRVGLANVRARLQTVSGGSLQVDSAPGAGCRVTIRLPK